MKITYDEKVDALEISFRERPRSARTKTVADGVNLDFDSKGLLVAIEVLDASRFASAEKLSEISEPVELLTLSQASEQSGLSADTLRSLINKKRLQGKKTGRDWKVTLSNLYNYLESRDTRGRSPKREFAKAG